MTIQIYDSFLGKKVNLVPIKKNKIGIYVCGITVYDHCHIGHGRTQVVFDMIVRYLRYKNYDVTYVRNITDIDDKIIKRAAKDNCSIEVLTEHMISEMHNDLNKLKVLKPDHEPKATENLRSIFKFIDILIKRKMAYFTENGDIYYRVEKFKEYGLLSKQNINSLRSGVRINPDMLKKNNLDFVLWKSAKRDEPFWASPWNNGRPGWHIECSAMSEKFLGKKFDIHGGGSDLKFPHHENEIAQSKVVNGCSPAKYWLHSGMVKFNGDKMSKSTGNFSTIKKVLKKYHPEVLRFFLLSSHYRSEINFSYINMDNAKDSVDRLYNALKNCKISSNLPDSADSYISKFDQAMNDDFNTPKAISVLFLLVRKINVLQLNNIDKADLYKNLLFSLASVLGILQYEVGHYFSYSNNRVEISPKEIENLIAERLSAKINKNYKLADSIRDKLLENNIILEDSFTGTTWKVIK